MPRAHRAFGTGGIECSDTVLDPLFESGRRVRRHGIGEADAASIEADDVANDPSRRIVRASRGSSSIVSMGMNPSITTSRSRVGLTQYLVGDEHAVVVGVLDALAHAAEPP